MICKSRAIEKKTLEAKTNSGVNELTLNFLIALSSRLKRKNFSNADLDYFFFFYVLQDVVAFSVTASQYHLTLSLSFSHTVGGFLWPAYQKTHEYSRSYCCACLLPSSVFTSSSSQLTGSCCVRFLMCANFFAVFWAFERIK